MKRAEFFIMVAVMIVCFCAYAHAGEWDTKSDVKIRPGMKVIKAGDANIIVAEGERPYQDSQGRIYQEPPDEYVARGFIETDGRFKAVKSEITELQDRVKTLEDKLEDVTEKLQELEGEKDKRGEI